MSIFGRGAHQGRAVAIAGRAMAMLLVLVVVSAGLEDARFVAAQKLDGRGEQFPKVGGRLTKLYQSHLDSTASESGGEGVTQGESVDMPGDGYVVIDAVADSDAAALLSDLEKLGLTSGERYGSVVSGWLPIEAIGAVSGLGELRFARESVAVTNTGSVENQADVATRADAARSLFGMDGTGVTVGVMSDSYDCLGGAAADVASGDLPADVVVLADVCSPGSDEGRAMLQLVHDIAPGATLLFHTAEGGQAAFAQGIHALADAGADVIVDDIIYLAEPMFQDGIVAQAVDEVAAMGVAYFSSAGNNGRNSYEGEFVDSGSDLFSPGLAHDFGGGDVFQSLAVPEGGSIDVVLQWDEPYSSAVDPAGPGSTNNLDMVLWNAAGTEIRGLALNNNLGGDPYERINFENPVGSGETAFLLSILKYEPSGGVHPKLFKYVIFGNGSISEHDTESGTTYGHANAAGAEAVGAAEYRDTPEFGVSPPLLEWFSSAGAVPILFDVNGNRLGTPEIRLKPEIVAPDGGNTTFFIPGYDLDGDGLPNFTGTSAAAPNAAAVAALMLDADPTLAPSDVNAGLETTAIDMKGAGFDFDSGYGLIQADAAVGAIVGELMVTVNSTADPGDGICDASECTLREAINVSNADPDMNTIAFDIPGDGPHTIQPVVGLPGIAQSTIIDGYTQSGAVPASDSPAVLMIELDGSIAGGSADGLWIDAENSVVKGLIVNRFGRHGFVLRTGGGIRIEGNIVGTDNAGTTSLGNGQVGVYIDGAPDITIGGTSVAARNVISGNRDSGIFISGDEATGISVLGNYIGVDPAGAGALGNIWHGIRLEAPGNTIGGLVSGAGNVISGNTMAGVYISTSNGDGSFNSVQGNLIGTDASGIGDVGNGRDGVLIDGGASNNTMGGSDPVAANTIAFNGEDGIELYSGIANSILGNSIHSNGDLGINLGGSGVTPNDVDDGDIGANDLQKFPVLPSAFVGVGTMIGGTLDSKPSTEFTLQFFSNSTCDVSGHGEGETFLSSHVVTTDAGGDVSFSVTFPETLPVGTPITSTATDPDGNTSEFSACAEVGITFTVNSTADPGDGVCDEAECTLRDAIIASNADPEKNAIAFDIPGAGPHTIQPTSALPILTDAVTIDGYTQPGASPNTASVEEASNATLVIELDGTNAGGMAHGLFLYGGGSIVRGLVINRFSDDAIGLLFEGDNLIEGNHIGTDISGSVDLGNFGWGVRIFDSDGNTVGGTDPWMRNIISGNEGGIIVSGTTPPVGNAIQGNFIGTDASGSAAVGNSFDGILLLGAIDTRIGGTQPGSGNVISGNGDDGLDIQSGTTGTLVQGNFIGISAAGDQAVGNLDSGVVIQSESSNNTIGGTNALARNVISGNGEEGVVIATPSTTGNLVEGNLIGTDATGEVAIGNSLEGILVDGASDNTIGGTEEGMGNVISGNGENGILLRNGATGIRVVGNRIGTDASGSTALGNVGAGVLIDESPNNTIGGTTPGAGNVISGNGSNDNQDGLAGIRITGNGASGNLVQGNFIGTDATGTQPLGNHVWGVRVEEAPGNTIGGVEAAARNVISGNESNGISFEGFGATGNVVQGNFIGTDATGTLPLANGNGVTVSAPGNTIGGTEGVTPGGPCTGACNLISGNIGGGSNGILLVESNNVVQGNFIGTDVTGTADLGNNLYGVNIRGEDNTIGGITAAERNVISGNGSGIVLDGSASGNKIRGNFIGTDTTGSIAIGNHARGIQILSTGNTVGGVEAGAGNVISGNQGRGIEISRDENIVQGNLIGTDLAGVGNLGNGGDGIWLVTIASENAIGGTEPNAGNTIAFNVGAGIFAESTTSENAFLGNSIHSNGGLGIDLNGDGVTPNDPGDSDSGANNLSNYPTITLVKDGSTVVEGVFENALSGTYRLEFFSVSTCDAAGYGEGSTFLGAFSMALVGSFSVSFDPEVEVGEFITATATDSNNNTSEFSACAIVPEADLSITKTVGNPTPNIGDEVTFTLTASNLGPNDASGVLVTDMIPEGLAYVSDDGSGGYDHEAGSWTVGAIVAGESAVLQITVLVENFGLVTNTATVSSDTHDPDPANNEYAVDAIPLAANLSITKSGDSDPVLVGSSLTYTLTVSNAGPDTATTVTVTDTLPEEISFDAATASQGACIELAGEVTCDLGAIATGAGALVTIDVTATRVGIIENWASISSDQGDPIPDDNSATVSTTVATTGEVKLVTGAALAGLGPLDGFGDLEAQAYFSDVQGTDLESDVFGVVFVVVEDDDQIANPHFSIVNENVSGQADGVATTFDLAAPIADDNRDGALDADDVTVRVNGVVQLGVSAVTVSNVTLSIAPLAGDTVTASYSTSNVDCLLNGDDPDDNGDCSLDTGEVSLVTATSDSDAVGISVMAHEVSLDAIEADGTPDLSDLSLYAESDTGLFVGAFALIRNEWKVLIAEWAGDNPEGTVGDLEGAVAAGASPFDALAPGDRDAVELRVGAFSGYLGIGAGDGADTLLVRLLGVAHGDAISVAYGDASPEAERTVEAAVDLEAPVVSNVGTEDGGYEPYGLFIGKFNATDADAGLPFTNLDDLIAVRVASPAEEGERIWSAFPIEDGVRVSFTIDRVDEADAAAAVGDNVPVTFTVIVSDGVGNATEVSWGFTIDILAPELQSVLTGWGVEFNEANDAVDEAGSWTLVENDDEWLALIFDNAVDGAVLSAADISIPGHTIEEIVWVGEVTVGALAVDGVGEYAGTLASLDIQQDGGGGMDLSVGSLNESGVTEFAVNDARHLVFVRVEGGSFDTDETPEITIAEGDVVDLAGNELAEDIEITAQNRLWPVLTVEAEWDLEAETVRVVITSSEDLDTNPELTMRLGAVAVVLDPELTTGVPVEWEAEADLDDLGLSAADFSGSGRLTFRVEGVDNTGNRALAGDDVLFGRHAEISLGTAAAADGPAGVTLNASRMLDGLTGADIPDSIGGFVARLTYDPVCLQILGTRSLDFTLGQPNINNETGVTLLAGFAGAAVPAPTGLGNVLVRLMGDATDTCALSVKITDMVDGDGEPVSWEPLVARFDFLRGDANGDGAVTLVDALFVQQYLAGTREACTWEMADGCVHVANAASVQHDGAFDEVSIVDALFLAQQQAGLRDGAFEAVGS